MCGRYRLTRADRLAETFGAVYASEPEDLRPRYNIAPSQPSPVTKLPISVIFCFISGVLCGMGSSPLLAKIMTDAANSIGRQRCHLQSDYWNMQTISSSLLIRLVRLALTFLESAVSSSGLKILCSRRTA
jgi:SOS response associated peptidase (SRAP)